MLTSQEGPEHPGPVMTTQRRPDKHGAQFCLDSGSVPAELFSFPRRSVSQLISGVPGSSDGS